MSSALTGTGQLIWVALRTGWRSAAAWVIGLVTLYLVTGASLAAVYDTPEKVAMYGASVGDALVMLTGRVAGLGTLGGVMMNEFAIIISFALPVMAIALTVRSTRREEESGRLELLLSARIGRFAPILAALIVAAGMILLLGVGLWAATLPFEIDRGGAILYAASIVTTGWVYVAATAVLAQVAGHSRTVWAASLALAGLTLVIRGIGDANGNWLSWLSPLGWHGLVRPFGDPSLAPLAVSLLAAVALAGLAVGLVGRRDVGAGMLPPRRGPAAASPWRASPLGVAVHQHLGAAVGWTIGVTALMGIYGGLMNVVVDAIASNPDLAVFLVDAGSIADAIVQMLIVFVGFLGAGFALQSLGGLRGEETSGRLELELATGRSRWTWLTLHTVIVAIGSAVVVVAGSVAFAVSTAAVLDDPALAGGIVTAGLSQLPAVLVFAGLSTLLFGAAPRLQALAWVPFVLAVVVTFMGPTLRLSTEQMRVSPFSAVGEAPTGPVDAVGVATLMVLAVALVAIGLAAFRGRDVPRP